MSGLPYSQPSGGGDKFEPGEHLGHLLLFFPIRYNPEEPTKFGVTTSATTDIIDVDTGQMISDAMVFGNLANSLRKDTGGGVVLGRLGQGVNTKGNPPWILNPFDPQMDPPRADPLLAQYKAGQFNQPAAGQQTPPAPAPQANGAAPGQWQPPAQTPAPQAAPAYAQQAPPTAPPQQQWSPPAAATPAPTPAPAAPASAVDPNLVKFLSDRGIQVTPDMGQAQCEAIARALPQ